MQLHDFCGGKIYLDITESPMMEGCKQSIWQYKQRQLMEKLAPDIKTFIDVGACLGYFTLSMAKHMNENSHIISFEPHPDNLYWLNKSINKNHYHSIKTFQTALSDKDEITDLYIGERRGWHSLFKNDEDTAKKISVKCVKLDTFLKKEKIEYPLLIKIDVEGAGLKVLNGMKKIIDNNPGIKFVMDMHPNRVDTADIFQFFYDCGFDIFSITHDLVPVSRILNPGLVEEIYVTQ